MAWTANTAVGARREQVMDVLTRPCSIASWAPVPFEVEGLKGDRLKTGSKARVAGRLAGKAVEFQVEVHQATEDNLHLTAYGPFVDLDVAYDITDGDHYAHVDAKIAVTGKGVMGRFVAKAVEGLLAGGALSVAMQQLAAAAENPDFEHQPLALAA